MGNPPPIRVFVSSTKEDQPERRRLVIEILEAFPRLQAVAQERFTAETVDSVTADEEKVESCDLVLFLLGHRYGSSPKGRKKSFTEREYDSRPLDQFLADKELVELRDHFFTVVR